MGVSGIDDASADEADVADSICKRRNRRPVSGAGIERTKQRLVVVMRRRIELRDVSLKVSPRSGHPAHH
jgi:hypothetical protein